MFSNFPLLCISYRTRAYPSFDEIARFVISSHGHFVYDDRCRFDSVVLL